MVTILAVLLSLPAYRQEAEFVVYDSEGRYAERVPSMLMCRKVAVRYHALMLASGDNYLSSCNPIYVL